jgi:hypothetical protein
MLTNDVAITVGVRKYRELYPEGAMPADLEEKGVLGATPGQYATSVHVTFSIRGKREPFCLFSAIIDRATGDTTVETAANWQELTQLELDDRQYLT